MNTDELILMFKFGMYYTLTKNHKNRSKIVTDYLQIFNKELTQTSTSEKAYELSMFLYYDLDTLNGHLENNALFNDYLEYQSSLNTYLMLGLEYKYDSQIMCRQIPLNILDHIRGNYMAEKREDIELEYNIIVNELLRAHADTVHQYPQRYKIIIAAKETNNELTEFKIYPNIIESASTIIANIVSGTYTYIIKTDVLQTLKTTYDGKNISESSLDSLKQLPIFEFK